MLKCTINGVELEVKPGTTIIQAMNDNAQRIAHYCWHPGLSVAGVCRLCMVEIEGNPRVQIACNTTITEGMKINNTSEKVKDAVKWGLDFHLINHPLDCPICDQAGECGLQDQYMEYGKYNPEMAEKKQKKHKVVDLGPTVVLDSERCILCSRCVRFTDEVSKTNELGIFNRGDHAEIGTHDGKQLDNKYSLNTVDICPVGALTSKDFRFKQRVWYLKDSETVCNGCSTGCNVKVYFNKEGLFRVKPKYNAEVNGHWMCDEGRNTYKFVNKEHRLQKSKKFVNGSWQAEVHAGQASMEAAQVLKASPAGEIALVLTGQQTVEEYEAILNTFVNTYQTKNVFHWWPQEAQAEEFDGLLIRGDKNPNTSGLKQALAKYGITAKWTDLEQGIKSGQLKHVVVFGPENTAVYPDLNQKLDLFAQAQNLTYFSTAKVPALENAAALKSVTLIPLKSYIEKDGTFVNYQGRAQQFKKATIVVSEALTGVEAAQLLAGQSLQIQVINEKNLFTAVSNTRKDQVTLDHRKKNEFVFNRGRL
ncbi:2Fe-2S iron-sulfur cluster-binding protein [Pseudobdellovibrio exovorus]|uniref:NADH dehydrogenase I chain G n=1 Tax=Pseudobdellovibrio exovorus JSS TaxID=1184267 RepID=M4V9T9_9BACT|nr:2Fe-2S iron-sulfur cluster-binding protein [Pseudobdellovibrio exovorus]AGH96162.1 NADH dehydrogenase I chain G [Pseudobdellovibrio exovorus JSS]